MSLEYHWIGATGNSINKYDWNSLNNWLVYDSTKVNTIVGPWSRATRVPEALDTVKIGEKFHCFSPLLFGGYTGGLTHSSGSWGVAGGVTSATAGVTDGGVMFVYVTDKPASDYGPSVSGALIYGVAGVNSRSPSGIWASFDGGAQDLVEALELINPHISDLSATGSASYDYNDSLYPFPYLGGGLTGEILDWVYTQHKTSYEAHAAVGNSAYAAANAWVGGGATGALEPRTQELRIRAKRVDMNPGIGNTSLQNTRIVNIKVNPDREKNGGTIQTVVNVNQYENPFHYYTIKNVVARTVNVMGDASVELLGVTAAQVNSDMHSTLKTDRNCSLGGLRVQSGQNTARYNVWPLYFAGQITAGAVSAVWGNAAQTIPVGTYANAIVVDPAPANFAGTGLTSVVQTSNLSPYIGIGEYQGGTSHFATIPSLILNSASEGGGPKHSLQFIGSAKIAEVELNGGEFVPSLLLTNGDPCEVYVGSLNISNRAIVRMNVNPAFDSLFMGGITGTNPSNFRLIGGINALDDTCVIYPDTGIRLVNTKILEGGQDASGKKNNTFFTVSRNDITALQGSLGIEQPKIALD
jgi:hypothetical protein